VADVEVGQTDPLEVPPAGEWIRPLTGLGKIMWNVQQAHGRKWYRKQQSRTRTVGIAESESKR